MRVHDIVYRHQEVSERMIYHDADGIPWYILGIYGQWWVLAMVV